VQIIEGDAHGVVADRLQLDNSYMRAAGDQCLLPGSVPLNLGRGLSIRRYSAGRQKRVPSSKATSSSFSAFFRHSSTGQRVVPPAR
jgi:hypothetical protein